MMEGRGIATSESRCMHSDMYLYILAKISINNDVLVLTPTLPLTLCKYSEISRRVTLTLTDVDKHSLPVAESCAYSYVKGIATDQSPCPPTYGKPEPVDQPGISRCVRESACPIVDHRLQMSVNRDPR